MSDVPSVVTLVDLLTNTSFVASAAVALVTSAAKLLVKVASAVALVDASVAKLLVKVVSAAVALVTSAAKALFILLEFVST